MFKYVLAATAALFMVSAAHAAEYRLGSITYDQNDDNDSVSKIFVRPVKCLSAIRLDVPKSSSAVRINNVKVSYVVKSGWGVDREKVMGHGFLRASESTGWISIPQKDTCVTAILVDGSGTWSPNRDGKLIVYGAE